MKMKPEPIPLSSAELRKLRSGYKRACKYFEDVANTILPKLGVESVPSLGPKGIHTITVHPGNQTTVIIYKKGGAVYVDPPGVCQPPVSKSRK